MDNSKSYTRAGFEIGIPLENIWRKDCEENNKKSVYEEKQKYPYRKGISKAAYAQIFVALDMNAKIMGGQVHKEGNKEVFSVREIQSDNTEPQ